MRHLFCFIFTFLSFTAIAQNAQPFVKANTITIETAGDPDSVFLAWGRHLAQSGYIIDKSDKDFLSLTTGPKDIDDYQIDFMVVSAVDGDGKIKVSLKWRTKSNTFTRTRASDYFQWEYRAGKYAHERAVQENFSKSIREFGPFVVRYSRE